MVFLRILGDNSRVGSHLGHLKITLYTLSSSCAKVFRKVLRHVKWKRTLAGLGEAGAGGGGCGCRGRSFEANPFASCQAKNSLQQEAQKIKAQAA